MLFVIRYIWDADDVICNTINVGYICDADDVLRDKNTNCDADDVICNAIYLGYLYKLESNMNIIWQWQGFL